MHHTDRDHRNNATNDLRFRAYPVNRARRFKEDSDEEPCESTKKMIAKKTIAINMMVKKKRAGRWVIWPGGINKNDIKISFIYI